ncbi:MAG TPA: hypothetical protein VMW57_01470 [Methyloceanibacter sp.]|nr:hypothetical protein [Methyloceanibacter sp.]
MPTLFRFLMILGSIVGVVAGSLYVLAEYFQPEPKEISKALRNFKAHPTDEPDATASTDAPAAPAFTAPPSHRAQ